MTVLFYAAAFLLLLLLFGLAFLRLEPQKLAKGMRLVGPVTVGAVGVGMMLLGRVGIGATLATMAAAWHMSGTARRRARPSRNRHSTVRTAALEMELDHDTGALEGIVLAGAFEGQVLSNLPMEQLLALAGELVSDSESTQLLEAYLDSRFPAWREHVQPNGDGGQGGAPASGPMTKQEAYKILGLEAGASAAEIRKAHRRLMQRLHPDLGGSSFLAARINEAKEILLSGHK